MADTTEPGRPDDERGADAPAPDGRAAAPQDAAREVPDAPAVPAAPDAPAERPVPDEATLASVAEPARVRRAPKIGAFITAGVLLGGLVGLVAALLASPSSGLAGSDPQAFISVLGGQGGARAISALIGAVVGGFAGAGAALLADRRSRR
ncbi:histidine kinase [Cellulomonas pakistanensis]|uniref:Histidine kinase n=1 Tax=Cellulomonas pakistanensis TaxID=992287 RepID=A0A919PDQ9_9CELL|nr:histidine kinase [Cellulomonas pakistanensis]GIG37024.1 hypothetical protein Cpa01nite_24050 [Cellulomonas pakistanensis]